MHDLQQAMEKHLVSKQAILHHHLMLLLDNYYNNLLIDYDEHLQN
jgi:hypothetical protein